MILKSTSMIANTQFSSIKSTSLESASASSLITSGGGGMSQSSTNEGFVMSTTDAVPSFIPTTATGNSLIFNMTIKTFFGSSHVSSIIHSSKSSNYN